MSEAKAPHPRYVLFHSVVRNDDHCPVCQLHHVSFHPSVDKASHHAMCLMGEKSAKEHRETLQKGFAVWVDEWERRSNGDRYRETLQKGFVVWIDEWARRSNGDRFRIAALASEMSHRLGGDYEEDDLTKALPEHETWYMSLHVSIRRSEWCPDNIIFRVAFHDSMDAASDKCIHSWWRETDYWSIEDMDDEERDDMKKELSEFRSVWKPHTDRHEKHGDSGDHFQVIAVKCNETICLNDCCPQLKQWLKDRDEKKT